MDIGWFSCGITSFIACKLAIEKYPDLEIYYLDTHSEHPDNKRLLKDAERILGKTIHVRSSKEYSDIWDVFEKKNYLVGPKFAHCTNELKKFVRRDVEKELDYDPRNGIQVFGYDNSEIQRADRFKKSNPEVEVYYPLIENNLSKEDCKRMAQDLGLELPTMYKLGFKNNNCIGCVKGGIGYWKKIRLHFPEQFKRMSDMEKKIGHTILKDRRNGGNIRLWLHELDAEIQEEEAIQCDFLCGMEVK